jgi:phenylpyruvate tautomerase PptA (4-oxalocrotonate tautomerase family)
MEVVAAAASMVEETVAVRISDIEKREWFVSRVRVPLYHLDRCASQPSSRC